MRYLFAFCFFPLIVGCSTTNMDQTTSVASKQINESSIIVCRQNGGHLALRGIDLLINGKEVATLRTGSIREVIIPAGLNRITFKFPFDVSIRNLEINVDVPQGATRNVVIGTNLESFIVLRKSGSFTTTWTAATVTEMKEECVSSIRPLDRM